MGTTVPTRIDATLFETAKVAGEVAHRSAAQQLAYWAKLGRELESATDVPARDLLSLATGSYDELNPGAQAAARVAMAEAIDQAIADLDMPAILADRERYSTADADGNVTVHRRDGGADGEAATSPRRAQAS